MKLENFAELVEIFKTAAKNDRHSVILAELKRINFPSSSSRNLTFLDREQEDGAGANKDAKKTRQFMTLGVVGCRGKGAKGRLGRQMGEAGDGRRISFLLNAEMAVHSYEDYEKKVCGVYGQVHFDSGVGMKVKSTGAAHLINKL